MCELLCIFINILIAQVQPVVTDSLLLHEQNVAVYEMSKIVVSDGVNIFETRDEYSDIIFKRFASHHCGLYLVNQHWDAYQADTMLTEEEFFTVTESLEMADKARGYQSKRRLMKWSSPFLIIGGALMMGISSDWGRKSESNATTVVGLGISLTGIVFGIEALSKPKRKKFEIEYAIFAMDSYNEALKESLGLKDSIAAEDNAIEITIDTCGIEVVPYYMLDEKPKRLINPKLPFPGLRFLPLEIVVQALIDTNGSVMICQTAKTSGIKAFDAVVLKAVQKMKFTPPKQHGQAVYTIVSMPFGWGTE